MYWLLFVGALIVIVLIIFCVWLPWKNKTKAPESNQNVNTENINSNDSSFDLKDNQNTNNENQNAITNSNSNKNTNLNNSADHNADYYYNQGLVYTSQKQYDKAIESFAQAIAKNSKEPDYYSKKAEAEVLAGKKQDAIATVQAGLVANPGDPNLQNKLNILQTIVK